MREKAIPAGEVLPGAALLRNVRSLARTARAKPLGAISLVVLILIWLAVWGAPVLTQYHWDQLYTGARFTPPTLAGSHYFGTDFTGRDVFSRVLYGGRLTLSTSLIATVGAVFLAAVFGIFSGYVLGLYDLIFQRIADALQALPALVVLMVVVAAFNQSRVAVLIVLMILQAPVSGRVLRSQTLIVRNLAYVEAASACGASGTRIVLRHVLPNVAPLIIVIFSISVGFNMLLLTTLSFLGLIDPSVPDWGSMLNVSSQQYLVVAPWSAIFPGAAISIAVLAYNLLGDATRDVLDPRLRGS